MGYEAATYEQRKVGDRFYLTITPNGATAPVTSEFMVVGVLDRTGSQDDGTVFLPFGIAQKLFNRPDSLTIVGVKLKEFSRRSIEDFTQRWITLPEVQVVGLEQVKSTLVSLIGTAQTMVAAVAVVAVLVAIIGVVNTILMSVYERTGEIGIMKAVGAYRGDIFRLIWIETVAVCISGGILGCILALIGSSAVAAAITSLVNLGVTGTLVRITPSVIGSALIGAVVVGFFAGLYPAWRAASMRPIDSIREGIG
jgi:putative ABC transport system permease protein